MILIEDVGGVWTDRVNWADKNNVLLGYDLGQNCCERAGWFVSTKPGIAAWDNTDPDDVSSVAVDNWEPFCFDPEFREAYHCAALDEGKAVCFRLVREDGEPLYLHIYDIQNGYYGHGFTFEVPGQDKVEDIL